MRRRKQARSIIHFKSLSSSSGFFLSQKYYRINTALKQISAIPSKKGQLRMYLGSLTLRKVSTAHTQPLAMLRPALLHLTRGGVPQIRGSAPFSLPSTYIHSYFFLQSGILIIIIKHKSTTNSDRDFLGRSLDRLWTNSAAKTPLSEHCYSPKLLFAPVIIKGS